MTRRGALTIMVAVLALSGCGGRSDADSPPPKDAKPSSNQNPDANMGAP
jgi:hypothetical protein